MTTINDGPNTPPPPGPYEGGHSGWNPSPPPRRSSGSWVKWVVGGVIAIILLCLLGVVFLAIVGKHNNNYVPQLPPASVQPVSPSTDNGQPPASADPGGGTGQYTTEEQQYLTYVHKDSAFVNVQDKDIVGVGKGVCSDLRNGKTVDNEVTILLNNKIPTKQAAELIAGAVVYLCPDQSSKLPNASTN